MKTHEKIEMPKLIFDKSLDRFKGQVLFPEQLKAANEFLAKAGLPGKELRRKRPLTPPDSDS